MNLARNKIAFLICIIAGLLFIAFTYPNENTQPSLPCQIITSKNWTRNHPLAEYSKDINENDIILIEINKSLINNLPQHSIQLKSFQYPIEGNSLDSWINVNQITEIRMAGAVTRNGGAIKWFYWHNNKYRGVVCLFLKKNTIASWAGGHAAITQAQTNTRTSDAN